MNCNKKIDLAGGRRNSSSTRRFLEMDGVQVATHAGISLISGGRNASNQTGLPCTLEVLSDWQLVCVIPVSERRNLSTPPTILLQHQQQYLHIHNHMHREFERNKMEKEKRGSKRRDTYIHWFGCLWE